MLSHLHEMLLCLFRSRPALAAELLRDVLHVPVPAHTQARIDSANLTQIRPTEYRADLVTVLLNKDPVLGVVIEAQLSIDEHKRYSWPVYVATLRSRLRCPVCLLILTDSESVACWAAKPIDLGGGNCFVPCVMQLSSVPEILDEAQARSDPELAVLSALAHAENSDTPKRARIAQYAMTASSALNDERRELYEDFVLESMKEETIEEVLGMLFDSRVWRLKPEGGFETRAEYGRHCHADGIAKGRLEVIQRQLTVRFGPLSSGARLITERASLEELDAICERLLSASTLEEALGPPY